MLDQEEVNAEQVEALRSATLTAAPAAATDAGWPQWRGPNRDGRAPVGPLRTDWKANPPKVRLVGPRRRRVLVLRGRQGPGLHAIVREWAGTRDLPSTPVPARNWPGTATRWTTRAWTYAHAKGPRATPTVEGDRVYAVGATGECLCLEMPIDGRPVREVWRQNLLTANFAGNCHSGVLPARR